MREDEEGRLSKQRDQVAGARANLGVFTEWRQLSGRAEGDCAVV